ncbi:hypothetical protein FB451DRAFT_1185652 [Mycena latifolia]|nr:hypothetical protein FB451DRAFT_1185652 [Mycena latifolia]
MALPSSTLLFVLLLTIYGYQYQSKCYGTPPSPFLPLILTVLGCMTEDIPNGHLVTWSPDDSDHLLGFSDLRAWLVSNRNTTIVTLNPGLDARRDHPISWSGCKVGYDPVSWSGCKLRSVVARTFYVALEHSCVALECSFKWLRNNIPVRPGLYSEHLAGTVEHEFKSNSDSSDQILMDANVLEFKLFRSLNLSLSQVLGLRIMV